MRSFIVWLAPYGPSRARRPNGSIARLCLLSLVALPMMLLAVMLINRKQASQRDKQRADDKPSPLKRKKALRAHARLVPRLALRPGDIVLFAPTGKPGPWLIDVATHSRYHHIALFAGRGQVIEAKSPLVRHAPIGRRSVTGLHLALPPRQKKTALAWARQQIGTRYDIRGLLHIILDRFLPHVHRNHPGFRRFTCAVFVAEAYQQAGIELLPGKDWTDLVPGDFTTLLKKPPQSHP